MTTTNAANWADVTAHAVRYMVRAGLVRAGRECGTGRVWRDDSAAHDAAQDAVALLVRRGGATDPDAVRAACRAVVRRERRRAFRESLAYRPGVRYVWEYPARPATSDRPARSELRFGPRPVAPGGTVTDLGARQTADRGASVHCWRVTYPARPGRPARGPRLSVRDYPPDADALARGVTLARRVWRGYVRPVRRAGDSAIRDALEYVGSDVHPLLPRILRDVTRGYTRTEAATRARVTPQYVGQLLAQLGKRLSERGTILPHSDAIVYTRARPLAPVAVAGPSRPAPTTDPLPAYRPDAGAARVLWCAARSEARRRERAARLMDMCRAVAEGFQLSPGEGI